ncbi:FadR family transcriptional regulator [Lacrimispora saccharolytica]|nr:FadR family transcriptional regulator [Lacrimispora saccharolytica]MBS6706533.1 FadR family transcriptional regulator [Lachnospiraceae bacterium]
MTHPEDKPLSSKLSEELLNYIRSENLKPGDRLPNESILAKKMGVGRSSIREAMKLLASRNIVTIRQGSGTYISQTPGMVDDPLGFSFIADKQKLAQDSLEVRFLLEPAIASLAAQNASEEDIALLRRLCQEVEDLVQLGQDHTQKDIEFHTAIALSSKNVVVPRLIPVINSAIPLLIELTGNTLKQETIDTHRALTDAIAAHNAAAAHDAMYLHLVYNRARMTHQ